jgi:uncharacterized protein with HEPN domain
MSRSAVEYLRDILDSIALLEQYAGARDVSSLDAASEGSDAISFRLAIVCEAATRLPPDIQALAPEIPWTKIRGTRNLIVHSYWHIDFGIVAVTLQNDLPALRSAVERLLPIAERTEK